MSNGNSVKRLETITSQLRSPTSSSSSANNASTNSRNSKNIIHDNDVIILSHARTPFGSYQGSLKEYTAIDLGAYAVKEAINRSTLSPDSIQQVILGNVISSNLGQAPAKQVLLKAGLPPTVVAYCVNKVCASSAKAISIGVSEIKLGNADVIVCGGMESMSNTPHMSNLRHPSVKKYGSHTLIDSLENDGLTDPYSKQNMGCVSEITASKLQFDRSSQDKYAERSFTRALQADKDGIYKKAIVPISLKDGTVISSDEGLKKVNISRIPDLRASFRHPTKSDHSSTITSATSSQMSDGASAVVLISGKKWKQLHESNLLPKNDHGSVCRILSAVDAELAPNDFPVAPAKAIQIACERAHVPLKKLSCIEINEAFAVVVLATLKSLDILPYAYDDNAITKVNVHGGAMSIGHPLGASGARITTVVADYLNSLTTTPQSQLSQIDIDENKSNNNNNNNNSNYGVAAICNGGGGATAILLESIKVQD